MFATKIIKEAKEKMRTWKVDESLIKMVKIENDKIIVEENGRKTEYMPQWA